MSLKFTGELCVMIIKNDTKFEQELTGQLIIRGEWPSGLRRCNKTRKVPGSKPARRSAGLRDPTSLRGSR